MHQKYSILISIVDHANVKTDSCLLTFSATCQNSLNCYTNKTEQIAWIIIEIVHPSLKNHQLGLINGHVLRKMNSADVADN